MKTLADIKRIVTAAGGTVEEDEGARDMRSLQVVAPAGQMWAGSDCRCRPVAWACGSTPSAREHNEVEFRDLVEGLSHGLRSMTDEEKFQHAED